MAFNGRIIYSGDEEVAKLWLHQAKQVFARLEFEETHVSGMRQRRRQLNDEGVWCEARIYEGGLNTLEIYAPPPSYEAIPDFYSGAVDPGLFYTLKADGVGEFGKKVTDDVQVVRRFFASSVECRPFVDAGELKPLGDTFSQRFAIPDQYMAGGIDTGRGEYVGKILPVAGHVYPSMYSGLMATVVQFLLGVGRLTWPTKDDKDEPNKSRDLLDKRVKNATPSDIIKRLAESERHSEIWYSWTADKTHGIVRADGWPVLVEVTRAGVDACLLPIDSQTDIRKELFTDKVPFDQIDHPVLVYLRARANSESKPEHAAYYKSMLYIIELFGGLPTGEVPKAVRKAKIDGRDVELKNWTTLLSAQGMKAWGDSRPYSSAMGWAFSPTANEARNTGYVGGYNTMAALDFVLSFNASVATDTDGKLIVAGSAHCTHRSAAIGPIATVKFPEPAINGVISIPKDRDPNGGDNPYGGKGPVYLHVYYDNGGTLHALQYQATQGNGTNKDVTQPGDCGMMQYKRLIFSNWQGTSPFTWNNRRISLGASQSTSIDKHPYGEAPVTRIVDVNDWNPANDIIRNASYAVERTAVWEQVTEVKHNYEKRESWVVPLYDRCALYRLEFERQDRSSKETIYGKEHSYVTGKRPWFRKIDQGTTPEHIWPTFTTEEGCAFTRVRPGWFPWKVVGDIGSFVAAPSNPTLQPSGPPPGCESCFPPYDISAGKCNSMTPESQFFPEPVTPPPVFEYTGDKWKMTLEFSNRVMSDKEVYTKTGATPPGVDSNPEIWYEVYGDWFTRSPDPVYGSVDYITAAVSCAGTAKNVCYDNDLNSSQYTLHTSFGMHSKSGPVPCFVGVLGAGSDTGVFA